MIRYTPAEARQILERAQTAQDRLAKLIPADLLTEANAALDLLKGLLDDSILVRELPPAAVRPDIILSRGEISAGRYHNAKEAQK